jgi:hypothetical protein
MAAASLAQQAITEVRGGGGGQHESEGDEPQGEQTAA